MATTIVITEKPSVAREYCKVLDIRGAAKTKGYVEGHSQVLNANVIVTWAVGHLVDLAPPQQQVSTWDDSNWTKEGLPILPQHYKYNVIGNTAEQFAVIKSLYTRKDIERIYYAGDSGREGIYIQALIRNQIFKTDPANIDERVVWIDSFTEAEILRGIKAAKPYKDYTNMISSGYARAIADWLIGMNFTIAFSVSAYARIITGRVVTPTLAMCVKRQEEIENFKKTDYYGIKADIGDGAEVFWEAREGSRFFESNKLYNESGFLDMADASALIDEFNSDMKLFILDTKVKREKEDAPYFFNQTDLQNFCSKKFHISPAETLAVAQKLYEAKFITYPRTSATVISTAVAGDLKTKHNFNIPKKYVNDKQIVDHYAIIPTFEGNPGSLQGLEKDIYDCILKRFMDTMKPPYEYDSITVLYRHKNREFFVEKYKNVINKGWKEVSDEDMKQRAIPQANVVIDVNSFSIRNLSTSPPTMYTTGTLVKEMQKAGKFIDDDELRAQIRACGLGTDATRAGIVQKLIDKGYITTDKKQKITVTDFGKKVIKLVEKYDEQLVSPVKTAELETNLSEISDGELNYDTFISNITDYVANTTKRIISSNVESLSASRQSLGKCPKCGSDVVRGKKGVYCTGKCGAMLGKVYGKELTDKQLEALLGGKPVTYKVGERKTTVLPEVEPHEYNGATYYNWKTEKNTVKSTKTHTCPCCGKALNPSLYGWMCEDRDNCKFSFPSNYCGHGFDEADLDYFLANGQTKVGQFVSKAGKNFDAFLVLNKEAHKFEMKFPNKR